MRGRRGMPLSGCGLGALTVSALGLIAGIVWGLYVSGHSHKALCPASNPHCVETSPTAPPVQMLPPR